MEEGPFQRRRLTLDPTGLVSTPDGTTDSITLLLCGLGLKGVRVMDKFDWVDLIPKFGEF